MFFRYKPSICIFVPFQGSVNFPGWKEFKQLVLKSTEAEELEFVLWIAFQHVKMPPSPQQIKV